MRIRRPRGSLGELLRRRSHAPSTRARLRRRRTPGREPGRRGHETVRPQTDEVPPDLPSLRLRRCDVAGCGSPASVRARGMRMVVGGRRRHSDAASPAQPAPRLVRRIRSCRRPAARQKRGARRRDHDRAPFLPPTPSPGLVSRWGATLRGGRRDRPRRPPRVGSTVRSPATLDGLCLSGAFGLAALRGARRSAIVETALRCAPDAAPSGAQLARHAAAALAATRPC
jgi:hypothetical protein